MAMTGHETVCGGGGDASIGRRLSQIVREGARLAPRGTGRPRRRAVEEVVHWAHGVGGVAAFAVSLPDAMRRPPWAGPAYGVTLWLLGFELVLAPLLGLARSPLMAWSRGSR